MSLTDKNITFSGTSRDIPVIRLRLRDDEVPERTEQLLFHLSLPPLLDFDLRLADNSSTTVLILDNDGEIADSDFVQSSSYILFRHVEMVGERLWNFLIDELCLWDLDDKILAP